MILAIDWANGNTTGSFVDVTRPSYQSGDLFLLHIGSPSNINVNSMPNGWSLLDQYKISGLSSFLFAKIAGSSEPTSYTFSFNGSGALSYRIIGFRGINNSQPIINITDYSGSGSPISLNKISLQQGTIVVAVSGHTSSAYSMNSSDNWKGGLPGYYGNIFYQYFAGASETENHIVFTNGDPNIYWNFWLIELNDATPYLDGELFTTWLTTDEPGSKLWVKISGEWKPAKVTII
jgi:hypothetical protein